MALTSFVCQECSHKFTRSDADIEELDGDFLDDVHKIFVCPECGSDVLDLIPEDEVDSDE